MKTNYLSPSLGTNPLASILFLIIVFITACATTEPKRSATHAGSKVQTGAEEAMINAELLAQSGLPEAPMQVGGNPSAEDYLSFSTALRQFAERRDKDDIHVLTDYLKAHPQSPWRVALLTNLGLIHYNAARFSLALDAFAAAWHEGEHIQGAGADKALVDRALGELMRMHARLGHKEDLRRLLADIKDRSLTGAATELVAGAREGLWTMENEPGVAYLCGPKALESIIDRFEPAGVKRPVIVTARSGVHGYSLNQMAALAKKAQLPYSMVRRKPGTEFVFPSVVHWKSNHYAALLEEQEGRVHIKDPTFGGDLWVTRQSLEQEASGYMLIPDGKRPKGYQSVTVAEANHVYGRGFTGSNDPDRYRPEDDKAKGDCDSKGMCRYNFHTMLVSLNLNDTPVGYQPPVGPPVRFTITYNQREANQPANFTYSNLGPKWTFNWLTYLMDDPANQAANISRYVAGGGMELHTGYNAATKSFQPQVSSQAVLVRAPTSLDPLRYELRWPDGSIDVYSKSDGSTVYPRKIFLIKKIDPQGNSVSLAYDTKRRITKITDAIGQVTKVAYEDPADVYKVTRVTDPFGRSATFTYAGGLLIASTDVINLQSQFSYGANQFINTLTTPYGATTFAYGENGSTRWLEATDPQGDKERLEYRHDAPGIPYSEPVVPQGLSPIFNAYINARNSFYWDKHAMKTAPGDYTKARLTHWLHGVNTSVSAGVKESDKQPLENRVWYSYPSQTWGGGVAAGMIEKPRQIARVLDDGSTQLYQYEYNALGKVLKEIDPVGRETVYEYAANNIDLLRVKQKNAITYDVLAEFTYNAKHRPLTYKDANGSVATFTWNADGQLRTITNALNQKITYNYNLNGYLTSILNPFARTQASFTYDDFKRLATFTDESAYKLSYSYDDLDRLTKITYPDTTTRLLTYDKLDLASVTDRLNRTTTYHYNRVRQLEQITDALQHITTFTWCGCGSLASITDALNQVTTFEYDVQGRLISKRYDDGQGLDYFHQNTTSLLKSRIDGLNQETQYTYDKDNALLDIVYLNALNPTPARHFSYDRYYPRLTAFDHGQGQTVLTYRNSGPTGAGKISSESAPDGYMISYSYDALNRPLTTGFTAPGGSGNNNSTLSYDALGRVISDSTAVGDFSYGYYSDSPRLSAKFYPNHWRQDREYYGVLDDLRVKYTLDYNTDYSEFSENTYFYDNEGQMTGWFRSVPGMVAVREFFKYDAMGQLKQVTGGTQGYAYAYDDAGNRTQETVGSQTTNAVFNNLNQLSTNDGGDSYLYDQEGNQTLRQSATLGNRRYLWDAENRLIAIEDPSNQTTRSDFDYDALGRRIGIRDKVNGVLTQDVRLLYCGSTLCGKKDNLTGSLTRYYSDGESRDGVGRYYHRDYLGSVRMITDELANLKASYFFDSYGRRTVLSGSSADSDFGYTGHFRHRASGLLLAPYRVYDVNMGRWLSRDPIGEQGGINLYGYVGNNPVNFIDFLGLAIGDYPPPPPGYNPDTWSIGQWDNGKWVLGDPDGGNWTIHPEDKGHWRHWDKADPNGKDQGQWPPNSKKPWPGQKKPKPDQCPVDPNGDADPWEPPLTDSGDNKSADPGVPFMPFPEWMPNFTPIRIPVPVMPLFVP